MAAIHLKRIASPATWPIKRKEATWITKPSGSHSYDLGMSINVVFKELLKLVKTTSETKTVLNNKTVTINGNSVKDVKRTFGFLDILSIKETKENYTLVLNKLKKLEPVKIDAKDASTKLSKVVGKTYLKNKKIQINLHDGINVNVDKDEYKVGDSVILNLADKKIKTVIPLKEKCLIYLTSGKHTGSTGTVEKVEKEHIVCKIEEGTFEVKKSQLIVIGNNKPEVTYFDVKTTKKSSKDSNDETNSDEKATKAVKKSSEDKK
jgi:small subunit ribosomal protein S4e